MGKKIISINEGKLSEFKLHSIWLRERLNGSEFVDQNNLQRLYEPSLLDDNLFINSHNVNENILNVEFSDGAKGSFNIDDLYNEINNIDVIPEKKIWNVSEQNFYTALELTSHSDNPYRKPVPGIQLLHCIANESTGGDSSLVDGFSVANFLRHNQPEFYKVLTEINVTFKFTDIDTILVDEAKLIELDHNNNFRQIRFSGRLDYVPLLEENNLDLFYNARKYMFKLCNSDDFKIKFRLSKGMIAMFDNLRLLHGRTKFDPNTGFRHLQGCYIDHDVTEGKLRRLLKP